MVLPARLLYKHIRATSLVPLLFNISASHHPIHLSTSLLYPLRSLTRMSTPPAKDVVFSLSPTPTNPSAPVTIPAHLSKDLNPEMIEKFPPFNTWLTTLQQSLSLQYSDSSHPFHSKPYTLRSIEIQGVDIFSSSKIGFLKFKASVKNEDGESLPGAVFMRGGSVAMLIILTPSPSPSASSEDSSTTNEPEEYAILTVQPRIAAGSLSFTELPAGMLDDSGSFAGAAAREIQEETGLTITQDELIDMTSLALDTPVPQSEEPLQPGIYPSPGGSDEFMPLFLARKTMARAEIEGLKGRLTGLRDQGEKITLKIVPLRDLWKEAGRDAKALAVLALYRELLREGRI